MQVAFEVKASEGKGLGLFVTEFVPKGTMVWKFSESSTKSMTEAEVRLWLKKLEELEGRDACRAFMEHIYCWEGKGIKILDEGTYTNHSRKRRCCGVPPEGFANDGQSSYAIRDLHPGDEILEDYSDYESPDWYLELCQAYGAMPTSKIAEFED